MAGIAVIIFTAGCSEIVPQGTKGKVLDRGGFKPEVHPPSRVSVGTFGHLVLVETVTHTVNEAVTIRMKDDMNLVAQVHFQLRINKEPASLNAVFSDIMPSDGGNTIKLQQVYNMHGKMLVNKIAREVLSQYNIADVNDNFNHISADIHNKTLAAFKPTPLVITDVVLGKLDYPEVIEKAIEAAAKHELEIKQAEADAQVRLAELKGEEQVAKDEYRLKMELARRTRDYNKIIAEGITPDLLELIKLEVQQELINAINKGELDSSILCVEHDWTSE